MTRIVLSQLANLLRRIAVELNAAGDQKHAGQLLNIAALLDSPLSAVVASKPRRTCRKCRVELPAYSFGRPRVYCPTCRPPESRRKVARKAGLRA